MWRSFRWCLWRSFSCGGLGAKVLFSPDEKWIALNEDMDPGFSGVFLFRLGKGGRYGQVGNAHISARSWALIRRTTPALKTAPFNRRYAEAVNWSGDSRDILIRIYAEDSNTLEGLDDWYCVFDTTKLKVSLDLAPLNKGKYHEAVH